MRILYGVCGTGMGHAMRSAVVARHLEAQGHGLTFMSYGGALQYLTQRWPAQTIPIADVHAVITKNKMDPVATWMAKMRRQKHSLSDHVLSFLLAAQAKPDVVISDFDMWSAHYAWLMNVPLLAVDNIHFISRCAHPPALYTRTPEEHVAELLAYPLANSLVNNAHRYLVTTFADVPVCKPRTTLHLPILRDEILRAKGAAAGDHIVTYFTSTADHLAITRALHQTGLPVRAYGKPHQKALSRIGNVTTCPFSDEAFIHDMATARAVVGSAGFTFMTEAIYLGKPMLAVPFGFQFEQMLNANYLSAMGYGERCDKLTGEALVTFLERAPAYERQLKNFVHDGNRELLHSVDAALGAA